MQRYVIPLVHFERIPHNYGVMGAPQFDGPTVWEAIYEFLKDTQDEKYVKHFVVTDWEEDPKLAPHRSQGSDLVIAKGTLKYTIILYTDEKA